MAVSNWLQDELDQIAKRREKSKVPASQSQPWGLALSGGGIRSATFCLGLIKALARNGLLKRFDYVSTVSGGGYAGSALGRVFQSVGDPAKVEAGLGKDDRLLWWWLRNNGRYLLPAGLRDSLFVAATMLRGLLAIYTDLFLVAVLAACVLVLPHLLGLGFGGELLRWMVWSPSVWWLFAAVMPAFALMGMWAYWFSAPTKPWRVYELSMLFAAFGLAFAAMMLWPEVVLRWIGAPPEKSCQWVARDLHLPLKVLGDISCLSGNARFALGQLAVSIPAAVLVAIIAGRDGDAAMARNGLTRVLMYVLNFALFFIAAALLDMASWWISGEITRGWHAFAVGGTGLLVLLALGRAILKWLRDAAATRTGSVGMERVAKVTGVVIAAIFFLFAASFVQLVVFHGGGFADARPPVSEPEVWAEQGWGRWLLLFIPSFLYVVSTGWNLASLNNSSLHNFYRARLTRSYLGVGNLARGFDPNALVATDPKAVDGLRRVSDVVPGDDVPMDKYVPHESGGPIHLVNVCVNQTIDDDTGEFNRDRNGRNMTVSSIGCDLGNARERVKLEYGDAGPPSLGQWIAISGAAAAPGMGANTSKGLAALFTLCGVRLGYWLDLVSRNGAALSPTSFLRRLLPKYAHLMDEMFATFPGSGDRRWYVSDGGHFENTGIYALLKREARVIVAADCGADPNYSFGDLNNLVRLARIDFNARITFLQAKKEPASNAQLLQHFGTLAEIAAPDSSSYLVLARVEYASKNTGYILVLKPALIHTLPLDLVTYKSANPAFPQQATADQFFDEAQWESYFRLGEELASSITVDMLGGLETLAGEFVGHMGEGLAAVADDAAANKPAPRPGARFAGEVVKSSLGIGAVAGVLISVWQMLDEHQAKAAAERRLYSEAVARAIEKAMDEDGELRVSDGTVFFLRTVLKPGEKRRADFDYSLADELVAQLHAKCEAHGSDIDEGVCHELALMKAKKGEDPRTSVTSYWPDAPNVAPADAAKKPPIPKPTDAAPTPAAPGAPPPATVGAPSPSPELTKTAKATPRPAAPPAIKEVIERCARDGGKVRLFLHVYRAEEAEALRDLGKKAPFDALQEVVSIASLENVVTTAQQRGTKPPYRWSAPTFIYHDEAQRGCAEALAAVYEQFIGPPAKVRPLPQRLKGQPGVIELWVPEGGAPKPLKS